MIGIALLMFVAFDAAVERWWPRKKPPLAFRFRSPRADADAYKPEDAAWVEDTLDACDQAKHEKRWDSYTYFLPNPIDSKYVNVNAAGLRMPKGARQDGKQQVFVFGGSTVWGLGVRDEHTIPAILQRLLTEAKIDASVVNYGQIMFNSTQSTIALLRALQHNAHPNVTVFYEGFNDVATAFQLGKAGVAFADEPIAKLVVDPDSIPLSMAKSTALFSRLQPMLTPPSPSAAKVDELTRGIIDTYRANIRAVQGMSKEFGFRPLFYVQPTIVQKKKLSDFEQQARASIDYGEQVIRTSYEHFRTDPALISDENYHFLGDLITDVDHPLFLDSCHFSDEGNELVAKRIFEDLAKVLRDTPAAKAD